MLRSQTNISINAEDFEKEQKLTSSGISKIDIYRAGMTVLIEKLGIEIDQAINKETPND